MAGDGFIQIQPLEADPSLIKPAAASEAAVPAGTGKICGLDVGSTTCKYTIATASGKLLGQAYERHNTRQAEKVLDFLTRLEKEHGFTPELDRVFFTGSGAGLIAPLVGGKVIQEVVAVAAAVEKLHPNVRFVSEIGGEDMKTIFFNGDGPSKSKQVLMQSACSGGTGTFIEKTARKLEIPVDRLSKMGYEGYTLHKISSKCGIFAEADANTLLKAGVSVEEIIASLFEAVVYQNLATLTRGNTPLPEILLLGGPKDCSRPGATIWAKCGENAKWRSRTTGAQSRSSVCPTTLFITQPRAVSRWGGEIRRPSASTWEPGNCAGGLKKDSTKKKRR
jgi:activator of 2-hydroxyglutaryl-CoA dehydratase